MSLAFLISSFYFIISDTRLPSFSQFTVVFKCFPLLTPEARERYSKLFPSVVVDGLGFLIVQYTTSKVIILFMPDCIFCPAIFIHSSPLWEIYF